MKRILSTLCRQVLGEVSRYIVSTQLVEAEAFVVYRVEMQQWVICWIL